MVDPLNTGNRLRSVPVAPHSALYCVGSPGVVVSRTHRWRRSGIGSYTGNALACRAALAVLDLFEGGNVIAANRDKAARLTALLAGVADHPRVEHFRHLGMIWAFDVMDAQPGFFRQWHERALAEGVFMRPIGNSVYFMPPYVIGEAEMALLARTSLNLLNAGA